MAISYVMPIQCKIKTGILERAPYVVGYFNNAGTAQAFRDWLESRLANGGKCGLNIKLKDAGNVEHPRPEMLTDVCDCYVGYRYFNENDQEESLIRKIVLPNLDEGVNSTDLSNIVSKFQVLTNKGNIRYANEMFYYNKRPYNVSEGGPATEKIFPVARP